ncbi:hypothetical protein B0H12DRAFT_648794 [Mycena haematopus]|nr:hypothetical protein B0H12DRAFT_648794 [Mycena haematopus]
MSWHCVPRKNAIFSIPSLRIWGRRLLARQSRRTSLYEDSHGPRSAATNTNGVLLSSILYFSIQPPCMTLVIELILKFNAKGFKPHR